MRKREKEREGEKDKHVCGGEEDKLEQNDSIPFDKDSKEKGKRERRTDRLIYMQRERERERERERGAGQTRKVKRNKERDE